MAGRPYRAGALEPVANFGDRVLLVGPAGVVGESAQASETWFECIFCEPIFGLGAKGTTLLWTQANAAPAGYSLPTGSGAASGNIAAAAQVQATSVLAFQLTTHQLVQARWVMRVIGGLNGNVVDDIDVLLNVPTGSPRFAVPTIQSRWNSRFQAPEPSDTTQGPAQGANQTAPAAAGYSAADYTNLNEFFVYEQTYLPTFTIINNGANALNVAGSAVGIDVFGFRMDLQPITAPESNWATRWLMGKQRMCPPGVPGVDYAVVPVSGRLAGAPVST